MPNFSDGLLHFKCSPSHSVMAAIGQKKNLSSISVSSRQHASVVCLCVVTHASYRINTFQSITPRVKIHWCKGGYSSLSNLICPTSSYTRQCVPSYQVQSRTQTDTLFCSFFLGGLVFLSCSHRTAPAEL